MDIGHHISKRYNKELEEIRSKVLNMGGLVEEQTSNAVKALLERDEQVAQKIDLTEPKINQMEIEIDDDCIQVIARRQPAASDLRLVFSVTKVITELERIGDESENISRYAAKLAKKKKKVVVSGMHDELLHLSELAVSMLHDSLDSFARLDEEKALQVLEKSDSLNKEFNHLSRLLITHMMEDPRNIKQVLRINWCARSLERIGNYAGNISEYVVYLVKGRDIRHSNLDAVLAEYFPDDE